MSDQPLGRGLGSLIPQRRQAPEPAPAPVRPFQPPVPPRATVRPAPISTPIEHALEPGQPIPPVTPPASKALATDRIYDIPVGLIDPNPHQPRHVITSEGIDDLVNSIRQHGILQPLIVKAERDRYQLIAGERRFRSAQQLGLTSVPALVRAAKDIEQLELAIVENVQRQDLNAIEEAVAYQQLADEFGLTQEEIATKVGKRRTTVANALRLLTLPPDMQQAIRQGTISASHAKVLLSAVTPGERESLFRKIMAEGLPVRAATTVGQQTTVRRYTRRKTDAHVQAAEDELRERFGTKVKITKRDHRGTISFDFYSDEDYEQLMNRLRLL